MKTQIIKHCLFFVTSTCFTFFIHAQDTVSKTLDSTYLKEQISIGAYIDSYYGFHSDQRKNQDIPYFVSMNQQHQFSINLAFLDFKYNSERVRARFAPGFGSYMNANYSNENGGFKYLLESSVGAKIHPKKDIWVDAGVLSSPYSNENAISKDQLMYTRSLASEYVPYYLCGVKLSLPLNKKLNAYLYILNGWQQIKDNNQEKAIGTQLEYKPDSLNLINWNTYIGDESSLQNPLYRIRYFSDIYWNHKLNGKFSFTTCLYAGFQSVLPNTKKTNNWYQANVIFRYRFKQKSSLSTRIEYFSDPNSIQIASINPQVKGFSTLGWGLCYNFQHSKNLLFRVEGRSFFSSEAQFFEKSNYVNYAYWFTTSFVFSFGN